MNRRKETEGGSPALRTRTKNYYSMGEEKSPEKWGKVPVRKIITVSVTGAIIVLLVPTIFHIV